MLLVVRQPDTLRSVALMAERLLHPYVGGLGVYWNHADFIRLPQRLGVLGVPGLLRSVRLPVVCCICKFLLAQTPTYPLTTSKQ